MTKVYLGMYLGELVVNEGMDMMRNRVVVVVLASRLFD
jgi:hypothetical protein